MSYIEQTLLPDETVLYRAWLHWFRYVECWALAISGGVLLSLAQRTQLMFEFWPRAEPLAALVGGLMVVVAFPMMLKAWLDQLTSEFVVTEERVLIKCGFIRRHTLELLLNRVESVGVNQSVLGRIFGFGTITVSGTGGTREKFRGIADPLTFRWCVQAIASDAGADHDRDERRSEIPANINPAPHALLIAASLLLSGMGAWVITSSAASKLFAPPLTVTSETRARFSNEPATTPELEPDLDQAQNAASHEASSGQPQAAEPTYLAAPEFDSMAYCRKIADTTGGSYVIENSCRMQEANAKGTVEAMAIPARVGSYCAEIGRSIGGSYLIYKTCVDQELSAASNL